MSRGCLERILLFFLMGADLLETIRIFQSRGSLDSMYRIQIGLLQRIFTQERIRIGNSLTLLGKVKIKDMKKYQLN